MGALLLTRRNGFGIAVILMVLANGLAFPLGRNAQEIKGREQENEKKKELVLETEIPRAVKLIAVRGIDGKDWFKHLEIEIENASEKHITYIEVFVAMPEIIVDGARAAFTLRYGNKVAEHARPGSSRERLEPGKTVVFRITKGQIDVIEKAIKVTGLGLSDVTRVVFNVYRVYFADGTGYVAAKPVALSFGKGSPLANRKSGGFLHTRDRSIVIWDI